MTNHPTVDIKESERFLDVIDSDATFFTFQTLDENKDRNDPKLCRTLHGSIHEHAKELTRLNKLGAGVFVTINETNGRGRKAEDIVRVRAVFVDLDGAPLEPVLQHRCPPHMVVETSAGKWHAYWRVDGLELSEFRAAQLKLISLFDGDEAVQDLPRVMRLPGFFHQKGEPQFVRIKETRLLATYGAIDFRTPVPAKIDSEPTNVDASAAVAAIIDSQCEKLANLDRNGRTRNVTLNRVAYTLGGLVGAGLADEEVVRQRLLDAGRDLDLKPSEATATVNSGLTAGKKSPWSPKLVLDPADPIRTARKMMDDRYRDASGNPLLLRHRETFWRWDSARYTEFKKEPVAAAVWSYTERAKAMGKEGPTDFKPNPDRVNAIIQALRAVAQSDDEADPPCWLTENGETPPAFEFMAFGNGLLHLPTGELHPPTPTFFNTAASSVQYDPEAPEPVQWLKFLKQIFGDDDEARRAVQEFFGYCLSTDTSQQKMLLMVGPPRSGKGTMARVLRELAGHDSVAGPTMSSLAGDFGLEPLIPRPIAIISDARIGQRTDKAAVTERLLSISGEDTMSVNRKGTSFWTGKLKTRFIIITNELPALSDGSGALANRFIIILLKTSFLDHEDTGLFDKLKVEMPGILNWTIEGYESLRQRGHFVQPASAREALDDMMRIGSPVRAFVADCCEVGSDYTVDADYLWDQWKDWATANGNMPGSKATFGKNLKTVVPGLVKRDRGHHDYYYAGVRLSDAKADAREAKDARRGEDIPF